MAGYKFLMDNYRAGDKICLFGFSRGAYTARALAGMLDKVGLLPKGNIQQVHFAYKAYTRTDKEGTRLAAGFKETFSQDVKVDFLGVWDTVQSTGVLVSRSLPFTDSNTSIRIFRHALSLDERRARFRPKLYHWPVEDGQPGQAPDQKSVTTRKSNSILSIFKQLFRRKHERNPSSQRIESDESMTGTISSVPDDEAASESGDVQTDFVPEEKFTTDVLEVWFSGCHSDVGGGNVENDVDISLAQIPLRWMVEHIMESGCGIRFNNDKLASLGLSELSFQPPATPGRKQSGPDNNCTFSGNGHVTGVVPDRRDAMPFAERSDAHAPMYDELGTNLFWWTLEFLPVSNIWQDGDRSWHSEWRVNWGKGRFIPFRGPKFHRTVKERMDYAPLKYTPRAIYDHDAVYV